MQQKEQAAYPVHECEGIERAHSLLAGPEYGDVLEAAILGIFLQHLVLFISQHFTPLLCDLLLNYLLLPLLFCQLARFDELGELVCLLRVEELFVEANRFLPVDVDHAIELLLLLLLFLELRPQLIQLLLALVQRVHYLPLRHSNHGQWQGGPQTYPWAGQIGGTGVSKQRELP